MDNSRPIGLLSHSGTALLDIKRKEKLIYDDMDTNIVIALVDDQVI